MASQSLVAFLAEAGATVEPVSNGETEVASQIAVDSVPSEDTASCPLSSDASLETAPPDATHTSDAHIYAAHTAPPEEEAQKGEAALESMDAVENIEKPLSPDNAMPSTIPSTEAIVTDCIQADCTPSTAAVAVSDASEAITIPSTETGPTLVDTMPSTEAVDSSATASVIIDAITVDSSATSSVPSTEAVIADSAHVMDPVAVTTTDSDAADTTAPVATDYAEPITTDSTIVEPTLSSPTSSIQVSSPASSKPGIDPPLEELNRSSAKPEEELPSELESIQIPVHWHPKPCVHISSIGGALTEEDEP